LQYQAKKTKPNTRIVADVEKDGYKLTKEEKMKHFIALFIASLLFIVHSHTDACTIVTVAKSEVVLAGNNEDWIFPFTKIWFIPAKKGEFGRICFGFDKLGYRPEGGMNDQGLFMDANGLGETDWQPIEGKETFNASQEHILAHCATVDDVIRLFKNYNCPRLKFGKVVIADRNGASLIVEFGQGQVQFLRKDDGYQISTNFIQTNYDPGSYPCYRYNTADAILRKAEKYSVDLVRTVLSAVSNEVGYPTQYSNIYDLRNGIIYLYNFHNFEEVVVLNLANELSKGKREISLPSLFSIQTYAQHQFIKRSPHALFLEIIESKGIETAIACYRFTNHINSGLGSLNITESFLNTLGYHMLGKDRIDDALKIFMLNVEEHPDSWNVYDSLGEAYLAAGDSASAIKNYEKSLELNPENINAKNALQKLRKK
jgi:tetratricopeptide (TPR) repeat protein